MSPKLAVIGASHFQLPLIAKAQEKGCEVHAFAWECGDVGETAADVFHPISIVDVDRIVETCRRVDVEGVCTIASDLGTVAVCTVADALGLTANSLECMRVSTDKGAMRQAFRQGGDPSPRSVVVAAADASRASERIRELRYPLIVKPTDRSGSRGVAKLEGPFDRPALDRALADAFDQSFSRQAVVEEFVDGDEFSVEGMSWCGEHRIVAITRKATTGAPRFIEKAHVQPAGLSPCAVRRVEVVVVHALDTLGVRFGASHSEVKVAPDGDVRIIEIGARMGGDYIGSHLVELSTGIDYVGAVVDVALGRQPDLAPRHDPAAAASLFVLEAEDRLLFERLTSEHPEYVRESGLERAVESLDTQAVTDSSTRLGHLVVSAPDARDLAPYLPAELAAHALG